MISSTQLRPGMVIKYNNELYSVFSVNHRTPGNLRGFVQAKMRSLRTGSMMENRFSSEDKVEKAILDEQEMEYLYDDGEYYRSEEHTSELQSRSEIVCRLLLEKKKQNQQTITSKKKKIEKKKTYTKMDKF